MSVRFPQQVAKELRKRAKAQNRSLNAQIVHEVEVNGLSKTAQTASPNTNTITVTRPEFETYTEGTRYR